jgi:hypothetical protein
MHETAVQQLAKVLDADERRSFAQVPMGGCRAARRACPRQTLSSMTISDEPAVRTFRRQMRVLCGSLVGIGVFVGSPGAVTSALACDWGRDVGFALWVALMAACAFALYGYSRNYGVEERRLAGRFRELSSPQATSAFSTSRGRVYTLRTRDGRVYKRVYLKDGYVMRVGFGTRLPFDPKDVIEVEGRRQ